MKIKRVVITGVGTVSPLGDGQDPLVQGIDQGKSAVRHMDEWGRYFGLSSQVAAPAELKDEKEIPRQIRRTMGRMSIFAAQAAKQALKDSGIDPSNVLGRMGCIVGSTMGSANSISDVFMTLINEKDVHQIPSGMFFKCMSHTVAANVAQYLGLTGRVLATSSACASSLQAIGAGYELISMGKQDALLCGGAEELHPMVTGAFDIVYATSVKYNESPDKTPRPFDKDRDGLVCGEGSGILMLEEHEHAVRRNARIYAEMVGYSTCGSGAHISQSDSASMIRCMNEALRIAEISPDEIDYVNAHATGTLQGDKEEADAIRGVFGGAVPVNSLKGYLGHTLGASGAIELIAALAMMERDVIYPTLNLDEVSPECGGIDHVRSRREKRIGALLKNSFAFGGINASLICKKYNS